jgi:hypothetical protein
MWIVTALLEEVPGGGYDCIVIIDNQGRMLFKQRKSFVYPSFGGAPAFQGNFHDMDVVSSPWGLLGVLNCAETSASSKRLLLAELKPSLIFIPYANPGATLLSNANLMAQEAGCPVVGTNMIFSGSQPGGYSRFVSASGSTLWEGGTSEVMQTWDLTVNPPTNITPYVDAGPVRTIRNPLDTLTMNGYAVDDGLPGDIVITWSKVSGPGTVTFENQQALNTTAAFSMPGVYLLQLEADDGDLTGSDRVSVNVLDSLGNDPALAGYWTFDNTTNDASAYGNHGTINGDPIYSTDSAPTGYANSHSLDLDGAGDYIEVNHHSSLDATDAVTVSAWVKPRTYPGFWPTGNDWASILSKGDWGVQNYQLGFGAYFYLHGDGMGMRIPCLDDTVRTPDHWYHAAIIFDASKKWGKIYINGQLDHTVYNLATLGANSLPLFMGTFDASSTSIDGKIDDVRVYTRALSDGEVAWLVPGALVNQVPMVEAGTDITAQVQDWVSLNGSYTDDGIPLTSASAKFTRWKKIRGPGEVYFENPFSMQTGASFSSAGNYLLELRGSDGAHLAYDTVTIQVGSTRIKAGGNRQGPTGRILYVSPVPFNSKIFIRGDPVSGPGNVEMIVYDFTGKPLAELTVAGDKLKAGFFWNVKNLSSGIYFVLIKNQIH